ncbi:MAG: methyltransferase [Betaproteobacteria bacterium RIFCSPLOWO2_02_FULL_64_12]|nr:MAG: methyltransferase [Betaproteobacteria bacterium RIFCSPLOWO2_02_FULL_64_12]
MAEINLLDRYPRAKRNVLARAAGKEENRAISMKFGREYFDGTREQGYGGYRYDGRWIPVAQTIVEHFKLKPGDRVLDVGCAKGFLVKDLMKVCPGLEAFGLDISEYALMHCEPEVVGRLHLGNALRLPFPDGSFQAVLSINTIHNLDHAGCLQALREMERLAPGRGFVQVDAYRTEAEQKLFLDWVLTAVSHGTPEFWRELIREAAYTGDYYWTILEIDPEWTVT